MRCCQDRQNEIRTFLTERNAKAAATTKGMTMVGRTVPASDPDDHNNDDKYLGVLASHSNHPVCSAMQYIPSP